MAKHPLFCFTAYIKNTRRTKTDNELDLIEKVYKMEPKAHTFAFDKSAFYGNIEVILGTDMKIQRVEDVENEFHFATRKERKKTFMINLCAKLELTELDCATFMFVTTNK